jgi:hypothetical protein
MKCDPQAVESAGAVIRELAVKVGKIAGERG